MQKSKHIKIFKRLFYGASLITVLVFLSPFYLINHLSWEKLDELGDASFIAYCLCLYLSIIGLVVGLKSKPKDWKVFLVSGILFIPHALTLLLKIVDCQGHYIEIVEWYIFILSFGLIIFPK